MIALIMVCEGAFRSFDNEVTFYTDLVWEAFTIHSGQMSMTNGKVIQQ